MRYFWFMSPYQTTNLADYTRLISNLPYLEQAFETKRSTWERESDQSALFKNFCDRAFKGPTLKISRADAFEAASRDFYDGLFTLVLWGYPRNMRGNTFQGILKTDALDRIQTAFSGDRYLSHDRFLSICKEMTGTGIGLSTLTKILYFFRFSVEGIPCLIFDRRIIEVCNAQVFSELSALVKITSFNKCDKYYQYLTTVQQITYAQGCKPDQLELFLFQFGNNLKPIHVSGSVV